MFEDEFDIFDHLIFRKENRICYVFTGLVLFCLGFHILGVAYWTLFISMVFFDDDQADWGEDEEDGTLDPCVDVPAEEILFNHEHLEHLLDLEEEIQELLLEVDDDELGETIKERNFDTIHHDDFLALFEDGLLEFKINIEDNIYIKNMWLDLSKPFFNCNTKLYKHSACDMNVVHYNMGILFNSKSRIQITQEFSHLPVEIVLTKNLNFKNLRETLNLKGILEVNETLDQKIKKLHQNQFGNIKSRNFKPLSKKLKKNISNIQDFYRLMDKEIKELDESKYNAIALEIKKSLGVDKNISTKNFYQMHKVTKPNYFKRVDIVEWNKMLKEIEKITDEEDREAKVYDMNAIKKTFFIQNRIIADLVAFSAISKGFHGESDYDFLNFMGLTGFSENELF
jgi:hypothetical protein